MENRNGKPKTRPGLHPTPPRHRGARGIPLRGWLLLILLPAGGLVVSTGQAQTTITVSTTADDNTTNSNCTLREALIAANTDAAVDTCPAGTGADTIVLAAATYTLTLTGTTATKGDLDVTSAVTIQGAGAGSTIIQAGTTNPVTSTCSDCVDRVFDIGGSGNLTLEDVTVRHGHATSANGGGIRVVSGGVLTITNCKISNNLIDASSPGAGGGIFNDKGTVTIQNSTISGNKSKQDKGGGVYNTGSSATMMIDNSTISDNIAGSDSTDHGGGIHNAASATLTITNSTLSGNTAGGDGGGIFAGAGTLTITNSTISGNTTGSDTGDKGGGIYDGSSTNTITLNNVTIARNKAGDGASAAIRILDDGTPPFTVNNSIITGNVKTNDSAADECDNGSFGAGTNNLIDDDTCGDAHRLGAIDAAAFDATLADNGGPTRTHALTGQGTATDGVEDGDLSTCTAAGVTADQRGVLRSGICDVGAFETTGDPAVTILGASGTGNDAGWRMMAPPAASLTRAAINGVTFSSSSGSGNDIVRRFDESAGTGDARWLNTGSSDALPHGLGFILYLFDDATDPIDPDLTVSFSGASETTGNIVTPGLDTNEEFHLLGNPFFTSFDLSSLNLISQGFQATVQVWDPTAGGGTGSFQNVVQGSPDDVIAMGQGFFGQRSSTSMGSTTLTFGSAGRTSGGSFVGKMEGAASGRGRIGLALMGRDAAGTRVYDEAATLLFLDEALDGWDAFEASKMTPLANQYVTVAFVGERGGVPEALAVASYPKTLTQPLVIPMQLDGRSFTGDLTLSWPVWNAIPATWQVTLVDHEAGARINLRQADSYTFAYEAPVGKAPATYQTILTQPQKPDAATARFDLEFTPAGATTNEDDAALPETHELSQNYPNPFTLKTTIRYTMPAAGPVRLVVYDVLGREVARLVDGFQTAGTYTAYFDAAGLGTGLYLYVLEAGPHRLRRTMLLVK